MTATGPVAPTGVAGGGKTDGVALGEGWTAVGSVDSDAPPPTLGRLSTETVTFETGPISDSVRSLLTGDMRLSEVAKATHSVEISYESEPYAVAAPGPRKRRGLTGKRYRQARRAYARLRRDWIRRGSPMSHNRVVIPRARVGER